MFIPLLMMKYVCLGPGAARAARCGHCWAEERVTSGSATDSNLILKQMNGLREAVRLFEKKGAVAVSESGGLKRNAPFLLFPFKKQKSGEKD